MPKKTKKTKKTKKSIRGGGYRPPTTLNHKDLLQIREEVRDGASNTEILRKWHIGESRLVSILEMNLPDQPAPVDDATVERKAIVDNFICTLLNTLPQGTSIDNVQIERRATGDGYFTSITTHTSLIVEV